MEMGTSEIASGAAKTKRVTKGFRARVLLNRRRRQQLSPAPSRSGGPNAGRFAFSMFVCTMLKRLKVKFVEPRERICQLRDSRLKVFDSSTEGGGRRRFPVERIRPC